MTKRTYNPAWPDSREARAERQRKRLARLNEIAQAVGYETWRMLETAALNGEIRLERIEDKMSHQQYQKYQQERERLMKLLSKAGVKSPGKEYPLIDSSKAINKGEMAEYWDQLEAMRSGLVLAQFKNEETAQYG